MNRQRRHSQTSWNVGTWNVGVAHLMVGMVVLGFLWVGGTALAAPDSPNQTPSASTPAGGSPTTGSPTTVPPTSVSPVGVKETGAGEQIAALVDEGSRAVVRAVARDVSPNPLQAIIKGGVALLLLLLAGLVVGRKGSLNPISGPGFEVISPTEKRSFIPLEDRYQAMDFVNKVETRGDLRISANLNKVSLSIRRYGYLMEDKNFRNALLVNRRRVRRTLLRDGDVLDLGDLTLLYRDNRKAKIIRYSSVTPGEGKSQIKFERMKGPVRRGMPMLVSDQSPNRIFYLSKNMISIGRSEKNDLIIKSRAVYFRHAKIERVGGQYKLQDLSLLGNTFVNNRRVEQRFLREGDEISIENHRFKFQFATKAMREKPPQPDQAADETQPSALGNEGSDGGLEQGGEEMGDESSYSA